MNQYIREELVVQDPNARQDVWFVSTPTSTTHPSSWFDLSGVVESGKNCDIAMSSPPPDSWIRREHTLYLGV